MFYILWAAEYLEERFLIDSTFCGRRREGGFYLYYEKDVEVPLETWKAVESP